MLEKLRRRLSTTNALPQLTLLGLVVGLLAGITVILFRESIETLQELYLSSEHDYRDISGIQRFWIPVLGALFLGICFHFLPKTLRQIGVVHVMERLAYHQGKLPLQNALVQFFGAITAVASGLSLGREGPGVHLGAASGSLLGQWLRLPNSSLSVLVACGVAGAIGASFNTPLAGVIFAMEVVLMEYTMASFAPVILASVTATTLTRMMYGAEPAFSVPAMHLGSAWELPIIVAMAFIIAIFAATFISLMRFFSQSLSGWPIWARMTLGGVATGVLALFVPEVMGVGYVTVNQTLLGELSLGLLLALALAKVVATTAGLGMGLPGGLIAPTLVIGAAVGGATGLIANNLFPGEVSNYGFYAMVGMGTMMAATLQAPLAALLAILELTGNPNILFPGMLAVVVATLLTSELFGRQSVFLSMMRARGLDYHHDPFTQSLRRTGVMSVLDNRFQILPRASSREAVENTLVLHPRWIVICEESQPISMLPGADLAQALSNDVEQTDFDLMAIPAMRKELAVISSRVTMHHALSLMQEQQLDALAVVEGKHVLGVVSLTDIEAHYRVPG
ncbi:MAG: chloride channel protein [Gammaproteobacteria bacterium]|nr:chloride channel protein [Gammaproteobacteria bacterium]